MIGNGRGIHNKWKYHRLYFIMSCTLFNSHILLSSTTCYKYFEIPIAKNCAGWKNAEVNNAKAMQFWDHRLVILLPFWLFNFSHTHAQWIHNRTNKILVSVMVSLCHICPLWLSFMKCHQVFQPTVLWVFLRKERVRKIGAYLYRFLKESREGKGESLYTLSWCSLDILCELSPSI